MHASHVLPVRIRAKPMAMALHLAKHVPLVPTQMNQHAQHVLPVKKAHMLPQQAQRTVYLVLPTRMQTKQVPIHVLPVPWAKHPTQVLRYVHHSHVTRISTSMAIRVKPMTTPTAEHMA